MNSQALLRFTPIFSLDQRIAYLEKQLGNYIQLSRQYQTLEQQYQQLAKEKETSRATFNTLQKLTEESTNQKIIALQATIASLKNELSQAHRTVEATAENFDVTRLVSDSLGNWSITEDEENIHQKIKSLESQVETLISEKKSQDYVIAQLQAENAALKKSQEESTRAATQLKLEAAAQTQLIEQLKAQNAALKQADKNSSVGESKSQTLPRKKWHSKPPRSSKGHYSTKQGLAPTSAFFKQIQSNTSPSQAGPRYRSRQSKQR